MRKAVTVSLPEALAEKLDAMSTQVGTSRSEIVRDALARYFTLREFREIRAALLVEAETKGIVTDEDVFDRVS
jgi:metal-responsive CopG/Arc/MetJ family transcriptional regulator